MNQDSHLEEMYDIFEGDLRKLDELIGQLELWSDEYTINHKKEDVRLVEYVELHYNLEALKEAVQAFMAERALEPAEKERIATYEAAYKAKLDKYQPTEATIHDWIRAIKDIPVIMMKSEILQQNKSYIESIIG